VSDIAPIILGTAGHIDHGKSTLVRRLTGIDPDRLPEEKERGLTIDLGFAPLVLRDGRKIGLIDVPGHERFIKNMVAGATSLDAVLFVVAADDGIMPQTREHLNILKILDVKRGLVVLTKVGIAGKEMAELVAEDLREMAHGSFLEGARILQVDSISGEGYEALLEAIHKLVKDTPARTDGGIFRMPVQRVFSAKGFGTIATGVPVSGRAKIGDTLEILPLGKTSRVRGLQAYKDDVSEIRAGHSSAVNLSDVDHDLVARGMVVATPGSLRPADHLNARFRFVNADAGRLKNLTSVRLHVGTAEAVGSLVLIEGQDLDPGAEALVQLRLEEPVVVAPGDLYVLRMQSPMIVLGGGRILSGTSGRPPGNRARLVADLRGAESSLGNARATVEHLLRRHGPEPVAVDALAKEALLPLAATFDHVAALKSRGIAVELPESKRLMHHDGLAEAVDRIAAALDAFHRENPVAVGTQKLALRTTSRLNSEVFEAALRSAVNTGRAAEDRGLWRRATHAVTLKPGEEKLVEAARALVLADRFNTPRVDEMAPRLGKTPQAVEKLLQMMIQTGELVKLKDDILLHRDAIAEAAAAVRTLGAAKGEITPGDVRDALKTTRKYIIPLLEHLDSIGVSERKGEKRFLKPVPPA
jgi:selenocysteine-specific elongation factor